jgi:hypothetical protein
MALKIKINIEEAKNYPNLFMLDELLVLSIEETQEEFIFSGIANSIFMELKIPREKQEKDENSLGAGTQSIDIQIPNNMEELSQFQITLQFAHQLFSMSSSPKQQSIADLISPRIASLRKKNNILKLQQELL